MLMKRVPRPRSRPAARTALALILPVLCLASVGMALAQQEEFTEVSVVVNVLKGANPATDQQIKDALEAANKILEQAKVKLVHAKTNRDVSDGGDDDGRVDPDERKKLEENGQKELDMVVGKGKGFKLYVARVCDTTDFTAVGNTVHNVPVGITEHPPEKDDWGYVIAHEFCHSFTLSGHRDPNGRTWGPENLMDPRFGGGSELTEAQEAEVRTKAGDRGTTKKQPAVNQPPVKKSQERGGGSDNRSGEGTEPSGIPPHSDLRRCEMVSDSTSGLFRGEIQLQGLLDPQQTAQSQILAYIDADASSATGQPVVVDGRPLGAEFRVEIQLTGGGGSLQLQGSLVDIGSGQSLPLAQPVLQTQNLISCFLDGGPDLAPQFDQISYEFSRSLLGPLALPAPVGILLHDTIAGTLDEQTFDLRLHPPAGPTLSLSSHFVPSGSPVTAVGTGFTPLTGVTLLVNDVEAATATTNAQGSFSAQFTAPIAETPYYWVDAREPAGGPSDFSILHVVQIGSIPAAGTWGLVILALLLAVAAAAILGRPVAPPAA